MTNDTRTPDEIERDIERERAGLTDTLDSLQDRFSVESIARQFTDQFQKHGGDIGHSVSEAVKRNPIGLALTGIGLAWLMLGDKTVDDDRHDRGNHRYRDDRYGRDRDYSGDAGRNSEYAGRQGDMASLSQGGARMQQPYDTSTGRYGSRRSRNSSLPSWAQGDTSGQDHDGVASRLRDAAGTASDGVSSAVSSAADAVGQAGSSIAGKVSEMGQSASDGAHGLASSASSLRHRLSEGTESLSEEARQRVMEARERAVDMRDSAMDYGRQGRDKAMDLLEEQPLIAGALAMAFGAAIGAALPRSDLEDAQMGAQSDHLFHEAERIFDEEKEKLAKVAKAATDEAKTIASEVKDNADQATASGSVTQAVADKASSSIERVANAAKSEADKQNVGDVKKS